VHSSSAFVIFLKWEPNRQNGVVIRGMKVSCRDLISATHRKADSSPQVKAAHDQTRRREILFPPVVLSVLKERRVKLDFGPELPEHTVLESIIPGVVSSHEVGIGCWEADPECTLQVEVAEALSIRDGRGNHRVQGSVLVVSGRQAPAEKCRKDIASMLLVCRKQPVFDKECNVAESIACRGIEGNRVLGTPNLGIVIDGIS